jgi:membrane protease YdiL (CAAX protease family)
MPPVDELTLLLADTALQGAGGFLFAVVLIRLLRSGQWRNPLAQLDFTGQGPGLVHLLGVVVAFYALLLVLGRAAGLDPAAIQVNGSDQWHIARCIEDCSKLVVCTPILVILRRHRSFGAGGTPRLGARGVALVSVAAVLIIMAIAYLQLQAGQIAWHWLEPDARPPVHTVLQALEQTAWGPWGAVQLSFAAVVVAPLVEELFFRGLLLQAIWRYLGHAWLAIVLSGMAFGFIHKEQPQDVLPLITMGVILGYVRVRYRSLTVCVLAHALFNARTMAFVLLNPEMSRGGW